MLGVIGGTDPDDEVTPIAPRIDFLSEIEKGLLGLKLGVLPETDLAAIYRKVRRLFIETLAEFALTRVQNQEFLKRRPLVEYHR